MSHFLYRRLINLSFLHNPFLKSFSTTPSSSSSSSSSSSFTVEYLINSCGLSLETALSTSKTLNLKGENLQKLDYALQFLNSSGFSKSQIINLITEVPCLLHSKVDTNLKPKFEFLLQMGFSNSDISELVISNPSILKRSLDNQLRPCFDYLKILVNSNEIILRAMKRSQRLISFDIDRTIVPNVAHLAKQGVSSSNISKLIWVEPNAIILGADRLVEVIEMVRKLGIKPESSMFVYGIGAMASMSKSIWEQKLEVFKSLGWSEEEIMKAFKREPNFMRISEEKLKRGMDFFLNTLKVERSVLILNPKLLMYGLDKRVIPRYAVLQVLKSKDLITTYKKLIWAFYIPEKAFLETHVLKYLDKVPDLLDVYRNTITVDGPILTVEKKYSNSQNPTVFGGPKKQEINSTPCKIDSVFPPRQNRRIDSAPCTDLKQLFHLQSLLNPAEQLWINCRLDFRHMKEAPTTEGMGAESNEIYLKARSLTKSGVQKCIFVLPPHIKHTLLDCLSKQHFLFLVSGAEGSSKNWYSEYLQFLLGWHATSRRHLSDRSLQNRVTAPAPSAKPPSYGPSQSSVPSPAISPSPNYQSPVEPPEPYDFFTPDDSVTPPSSSKHSSASPDSAPVLPSQGSGSSKRTVAIAVGVTATVTFLLVAFLFYCARKCFGNKNGSGDGPKDDRPLLSLSFSDFSSGSSKKSYNFGNSLNKEKFEKLSFQASSGHNGRSSSLEMRPMENISHSSISEIIPSSREPFTASSNIHVPLPPPPGMPLIKKASPSPPPPPISSGVNPGPPPPPPPKAPPPPPPKAPAPPPPKAPALPKGPPPPKGAFPPRPPQPGVLPPKLTKQSASENDSSKTKLKPFFWDKVLANPDQSMVWHQISSGSFQFNEEMIESLFGYNAADKQKGERKKESSSSDPSSQYIQIIDPKKSQNLAILLRALNVTIEEVCDALSEGNELPTELLQTLLKMSPTAEEELKLRLFSGELSQLGPAERFLKALVDIPFAFKRLDALLYMGSFREEVSSLKESFATLEVACKELRNSRLFLKLLEAVLKTGNRMNDGTFRGGAQAFKLDTLLKLADVKGADGKTTLLHFVVQEIIRSEGVRALRQIRESGSFSSITSEDLAEDTYNETEDHYRSLGLQVVSGLSSELEHVKKAAVLDADALTSTVSILGHGLVKTKEFINTEMKSMDEESQFYKTLKHFVDNAEIDVTWLLEEEKKIRSLVKSTTDYFHGKAGKDEGLHLFVIVRDFLGMLDKTCKAVREAPKNVPKMPTIKESPAVPQVLDARQHLFPAIRDRRMGGSDSDED